MVIAKYLPSARLQDYIKYYWRMTGLASQVVRSRDIPDGNIEVILNFGSPFSKYELQEQPTTHYHSRIKGQFDHAVIIEQSGTVDIIGISFKPWGLHPFLKESVSVITNEAAPSDVLIAKEIEAQLYDHRGLSEWVQILDRYLLKKLDHNYSENTRLTASVDILSRMQSVPIKATCRKVGIGIKSLERLYKERIGLTPKQFQRIRRMQNLIRIIKRKEPISRMKLIVDLGFYDQAHLTKEFVLLTGTTPSAFNAHIDTFSAHHDDLGTVL